MTQEEFKYIKTTGAQIVIILGGIAVLLLLILIKL